MTLSLAGRRWPRSVGRGVPVVDVDLYAPEVLRDSRAEFVQVRDAGPVVWLPRHGMWAMGRFEEVRAALRDNATFLSGDGVAANPLTNLAARRTTISSDGDVHRRRRKVLMQSLGAKALGPIEGQIDAEARRLVERHLGGQPFDAVADLAAGLPVQVVADLVGVRVDSEQMLKWAAGTFDVLGPINHRSARTVRQGIELLLYTQRLSRSRVVPGSWASTVFDAADRGEISPAEARAMVIDFVAPSLDTTILATAHLLWLLGRHPEVWTAIREDDDLIGPAVVEAVRLASPIRGFTRRLAADTTIGAVTMRAGSRVALLFGAANLDERQFPDPERFDPRRSGAAHLGWGNGPHTCVGIHLAKLEMRALLRAMVPEVEAIEVGEPTRLTNNTLQGITALPATLRRAAD